MTKLNYANWNTVNELATKQVGKFSVYISNNFEYVSESENLAWDFVIQEIANLFGAGTTEYFEYMSNVIHGGLFFFESKEKASKFYKIFEQELTNSTAIYASLISPIDGCLTENT